MSRYNVIEVQCLECNRGESDPKIIASFDDLRRASNIARATSESSESDRFIFDTVASRIVSPSEWVTLPIYGILRPIDGTVTIGRDTPTESVWPRPGYIR